MGDLKKEKCIHTNNGWLGDRPCRGAYLDQESQGAEFGGTDAMIQRARAAGLRHNISILLFHVKYFSCKAYIFFDHLCFRETKALCLEIQVWTGRRPALCLAVYTWQDSGTRGSVRQSWGSGTWMCVPAWGTVTDYKAQTPQKPWLSGHCLFQFTLFAFLISKWIPHGQMINCTIIQCSAFLSYLCKAKYTEKAFGIRADIVN